MTKGQKIVVALSTVAVSVIVGGLLYLYFNRKAVLKKLTSGEGVIYKLKEPKLPIHKGSEYILKLNKDAKSQDGYAIFLYQDGDVKGQYWMIDDTPYYVTKKNQTEISNKSEARFVKYLLNNA